MNREEESAQAIEGILSDRLLCGEQNCATCDQ